MNISDFMNESINLKHAIDVFKFNRDYRRAHPDEMHVSGLLTFCGAQGEGKTLSAVNYLKQLIDFYPKSILVTNTEIKGLPEDYKVIMYKNLNELIKYFEIINNGEYGVIYFIDEIQVLFNALLKRGMNVEVLEVISQQRKQRKHIIGTAQVFMKIDKVFREQMKNVVICSKKIGCLQWNKLIDGDSLVEENGKVKFDVKKYAIWFHQPKMYTSYDTYSIISAYREEFKNSVIDTESLNTLMKLYKPKQEGGVVDGLSGNN